VIDIKTQFTQVVALRLKNGDDILESLSRYVTDNGIHNAVFLSAFGSVTHYHFHVVASGELPPAEEYPKGEKALDVVALTGGVLSGRVHAHITFTDDKIAFGGHLEPDCKVLTFLVVYLGVLEAQEDMSDWDDFTNLR
jgi:predicted DNA-binding protein with PD1-like motif